MRVKSSDSERSKRMGSGGRVLNSEINFVTEAGEERERERSPLGIELKREEE